MNYNWSKSDYPKSHGKTVFSTFACGGGSTMGYKLAGYDVLAANDIDPKMEVIYKENHNPKHYFLCDIRELPKQELPPELYNLDILDGSPPCTSFSIAGKREKDWGKKKKFTEGQALQTLDDLYFRFLELADVLKPKIIVSENVSGLVKGRAKIYWKNILKKFDEIGYTAQTFLLNSATMGVPQRRERVFIIGHRKDLKLPDLKLDYNIKPILFGQIRSTHGKEVTEHEKKLLLNCKKEDKCFAHIVKRINGKLSGFNQMIVSDDEVCPTMVCSGVMYRRADNKSLSDIDMIRAGSFPHDYNFKGQRVKYIIGMSVPPIMMQRIATDIYKQWLMK